MHRITAIAAATLALSGAGLFAGAAFAGIGEELTLAQTHALLAYRTGGRGERGIAQARMHFHHVLNCLVGPGGKGYDLTAPVMPAGRGRGGAAGAQADAAPPAPPAPPNMDPCASDKTNKGALNDAASPAQKQKVQAAIDLATTALTISDNEKVTEAATALADAVGEAKETK